MNSRPVKRVEDVIRLRAAQFTEDSGESECSVCAAELIDLVAGHVQPHSPLPHSSALTLSCAPQAPWRTRSGPRATSRRAEGHAGTLRMPCTAAAAAACCCSLIRGLGLPSFSPLFTPLQTPSKCPS